MGESELPGGAARSAARPYRGSHWEPLGITGSHWEPLGVSCLQGGKRERNRREEEVVSWRVGCLESTKSWVLDASTHKGSVDLGACCWAVL